MSTRSGKSRGKSPKLSSQEYMSLEHVQKEIRNREAFLAAATARGDEFLKQVDRAGIIIIRYPEYTADSSLADDVSSYRQFERDVRDLKAAVRRADPGRYKWHTDADRNFIVAAVRKPEVAAATPTAKPN